MYFNLQNDNYSNHKIHPRVNYYHSNNYVVQVYSYSADSTLKVAYRPASKFTLEWQQQQQSQQQRTQRTLGHYHCLLRTLQLMQNCG